MKKPENALLNEFYFFPCKNTTPFADLSVVKLPAIDAFSLLKNRKAGPAEERTRGLFPISPPSAGHRRQMHHPQLQIRLCLPWIPS
jgi:hypothetical protein